MGYRPHPQNQRPPTSLRRVEPNIPASFGQVRGREFRCGAGAGLRRDPVRAFGGRGQPSPASWRGRDGWGWLLPGRAVCASCHDCYAPPGWKPSAMVCSQSLPRCWSWRFLIHPPGTALEQLRGRVACLPRLLSSAFLTIGGCVARPRLDHRSVDSEPTRCCCASTCCSLLVVAFLPFPTKLIAEAGNRGHRR